MEYQVNTNSVLNKLVVIRYQIDIIMASMADNESPRSIRIPRDIWEALDRDALRCRRSSSKQLEAILIAYFSIENIEINSRGIAKAQLDNNYEDANSNVKPLNSKIGESQDQWKEGQKIERKKKDKVG